jgi:virulence factor Mce-like protein
MPKGRKKVEIFVGIFVLFSLALLLAMVILIGRRQNVFEKRYEITGVFKSVAGLQPGAEVHLAGINIGYIKNIEFNRANEVEVIMSVSEAQSQRIRMDSVACIRTMGLMGDRYVQITVGSEDEEPIPAGGKITTSEMLELEEIFETARPAIADIENAIENISEVTDRLADPEGDVGVILQNVKTLTTNAREGQGTIGKMLVRDDIYQQTSEVLDTTQETMQNLKDVSANAKEASVRFPDIMDEAKTGVGKFVEFSALATEAAVEVYTIMGSGKEAAKDFEVMAANLKSASADIREVTPKLDGLIESADEGVSETRKVIEAAKRSWLIRGYFQPITPGEPIVVTGRDIAQPEVRK